MLRDAWANPATNAVVLHALGGAGKSAILRAFANELLAKGGAGAARVYGWSAYSQGAGNQLRADADSFIAAALTDFGYDGPPISDSMERARRLAKLIQSQRCLLLLDGLEPLQNPPGDNKGRFTNKALAELIRTLGLQNPGLMVITTRQEVYELEGMGALVQNRALDQLSPEAGAELLVELGATGRQKDLQAAVEDVLGHALSVTLLGTYIAELAGGDIRKRDQFKFGDIIDKPEEFELADKTEIYAKRAGKVMRGYLQQFDRLEKAAGLGGAERVLLHLLGLFDRPADGGAVQLLLGAHIPGLNDELYFEVLQKSKFFGFKKWSETRELAPEERRARLREAKRRLRKLRLLASANPRDPHELDAHPVVRAFFATRLEDTPEAAKQAHEKLYHFYASLAPDRPDTLEEMQPLFNALPHGVKSGHAQQAYDEVFQRRIRRGNDHYITRVLRAFGADLAATTQFFEEPWTTPDQSLTPDVQAWLLAGAAFALTALGRPRDSLKPREAARDMAVAQENWWNAAIAGGELTDTLLSLGEVARATAAAETALTHAENSKDAQQREFRRTNLGQALLTAGDLPRAHTLFQEAEKMLSVRRPDLKQLPSLQGYQYGDLKLALGETEVSALSEAQTDAMARGHYQLALARDYTKQGGPIADLGFGWLLIGRARHALEQRGLDPDAQTFTIPPEQATDTRTALDNAVEWLRKAGMEDELPKALLARAAYLRFCAAASQDAARSALITACRTDLDEVADIAGDEMRLPLTDLALERARCALDLPDAFSDAAQHLAQAAQLINETGYHRRDGELQTLKERLAQT